MVIVKKNENTIHETFDLTYMVVIESINSYYLESTFIGAFFETKTTSVRCVHEIIKDDV